jgi:hypothetical protein
LGAGRQSRKEAHGQERPEAGEKFHEHQFKIGWRDGYQSKQSHARRMVSMRKVTVKTPDYRFLRDANYQVILNLQTIAIDERAGRVFFGVVVI